MLGFCLREKCWIMRQLYLRARPRSYCYGGDKKALEKFKLEISSDVKMSPGHRKDRMQKTASYCLDFTNNWLNEDRCKSWFCSSFCACSSTNGRSLKHLPDLASSERRKVPRHIFPKLVGAILLIILFLTCHFNTPVQSSWCQPWGWVRI